MLEIRIASKEWWAPRQFLWMAPRLKLSSCAACRQRAEASRGGQWMKLHGSFFLVDSCRIDVLICFIKKNITNTIGRLRLRH